MRAQRKSLDNINMETKKNMNVHSCHIAEIEKAKEWPNKRGPFCLL